MLKKKVAAEVQGTTADHTRTPALEPTTVAPLMRSGQNQQKSWRFQTTILSTAMAIPSTDLMVSVGLESPSPEWQKSVNTPLLQ